jgi:RimJ/RimL family protein N-acetyltransferase
MTNARSGAEDRSVRLRPFVATDLETYLRFATDPAFSLPFEWSGYASPQVLRRRFEEDGFLEKDPHLLAVADAGGKMLGWVMWRDANFAGRRGAGWEIGALLAPEHRGKGVGTAAQRLLVEHLFATTPVHRLSANTEPDNLAEQRCLEKCGFRREGWLRQAGFRGGAWRDVFVYGLLRSDEDDAASPSGGGG